MKYTVTQREIDALKAAAADEPQTVCWTMAELKAAMGFAKIPMSSLSIRLNGQPIPGNSIIEVKQ